MNKIEDERRYHRSWNEEIIGRFLVTKNFLSQRQGYPDDESANPFQQDGNDGQLRNNGRMSEAPDFRLVKDAKIFFGSCIGSFGS